MIIKKPIIFNLLKHHHNYIIQKVNSINNFSSFNKLLNELKNIGDSKMDLYLGTFTPSQLIQYTINYLKSINAFKKENFIIWLKKEGNDYQLINFPDNSIWTFRLGAEHYNRYIHIHPARKSPLTTRVKATTLKTTIALLAYSQIKKINEINLNIINSIRKEYLDLSSIKSLKSNEEIIRCIELLT